MAVLRKKRARMVVRIASKEKGLTFTLNAIAMCEAVNALPTRCTA